MNEGIYVLLGALIGGIVSLLATYLTLKHSTRIELKKLSLSFLIEKKNLLEKLINDCSSFEYTGNMEEDEGCVIDEYKIISEFVYQKSHYFIESKDFQKLQEYLVEISNDNYRSPFEIVHYKGFFNCDANKFFKKELENVMREINKIIQH